MDKVEPVTCLQPWFVGSRLGGSGSRECSQHAAGGLPLHSQRMLLEWQGASRAWEVPRLTWPNFLSSLCESLTMPHVVTGQNEVYRFFDHLVIGREG